MDASERCAVENVLTSLLLTPNERQDAPTAAYFVRLEVNVILPP
jgi:hypothetical protein